LSNVDTAGYRARRVFSQLLAGGVPSMGTVVDRRAGELQETGAPLDLALSGPGSFVVRSGGREELVRSGSFTLDPDGRIVDVHGRALLGEAGELVLPPGPVLIDARGQVSVAGEPIGRLRIEPEDPPGSATAGAGDADTTARPDVARANPLGNEFAVRQGYLEGSNVGALDQLVELSMIQRSYEAVSNSVRAIDSVLDTIANRLGRVG
jgi:flagellar basal body rod protein FlgG